MTVDWQAYLRDFHAERPGITEHVLCHSADPLLGNPYEWLSRALPARPGDVLDLTCGNAALLPWLRGQRSYMGFDLSAGELALGRAHGRGPLVRADVRQLPLPGSSVDTVISSMGLMLVQPLAAGVAEIARVLRPGGIVALLLPGLWPIRVRDVPLGVRLAVALSGVGSMPQQVSPRRLRRLSATAGLSLVESSRHRFPFPLRTRADAALAVRGLYTPGRTPAQLARAEALLAARIGPTSELPVPLLRVVARLR